MGSLSTEQGVSNAEVKSALSTPHSALRIPRSTMACLLLGVFLLLSTAGMAMAQEEEAKEPIASRDRAIGFVAVAFVMCVSCAAAAYAVGKVGSAAMGACAEKPELVGRALIFVAIGEGIAVFGLIVAVLLLQKL